jgi:hypothetical protein
VRGAAEQQAHDPRCAKRELGDAYGSQRQQRETRHERDDVMTAGDRPVPQQIVGHREHEQESQGPWTHGYTLVVVRDGTMMGTLAGEVLWLHKSLPSF